tara:strand:+ start:1873 stop:2784 length:912 start_codon:yes stop_codon:yes gene_type:complete
MDQLGKHSPMDLSLEEERRVARTFMGRVEWEMIVIGLGQCAVWLCTWIMVLKGHIPLMVGCVVSIVSTVFAYLPSHAGQHGHLSGKYKKLDWLNFLVGQISLIPLAQSHAILKATHMKHHAHANDPTRDPDYYHTHVDSWFHAAVRIQNQTGEGALVEMLRRFSQEDPSFANAVGRGAKVNGIFFFAQLGAVFIYPLETFLLWWVPRKIAVAYLGMVFSYAPHKDLSIGRYRDTRFWSSILPRYLNHSMQIHAMHHMYPNICHHDEPKAIEVLKPFMIARGIPGAQDLPDKIRLNALVRGMRS